jgi:hypothetical protein
MGAVTRILGVLLVIGACNTSPPKPCKVNEQCFLCPDAKSLALCQRDPAAARHCKWTPPDKCPR